jgi:precorrin-6B methylase 2
VAARDNRTEFWERARTITPYLVAETRFGRFIAPTQDDELGRALFVHKDHHPELLALRAAVRVLQRDRRAKWPTGLALVDVGAGLGLRCVPALAQFGFARAVAHEADPRLARLVRANARLNGCEERIRVTMEPMGEPSADDDAQVGLLWIGARQPLPDVLVAAGPLIEQEVPIVVEVTPARLEPAAREALVVALDGRYAHVAVVGHHAADAEPLESLAAAEPAGSHLLVTTLGGPRARR